MSTKAFNYYCLFFLLICRFFISASIYWSEKIEIPYWAELTFQCLSYTLISIVLWINKKELTEINVDKFFVFIFITLGFVYVALIPLGFGITLASATLLAVGLIFSKKTVYAKNALDGSSLIIFTGLLLLLDFTYFLVIRNAELFVNSSTLINAFFWINPPVILVEEFLFRGLLWKVLREFEVSENKIIYIQGFMFWVCHFYLDPVVFWIFLPLTSLLLGYLVVRSKSITAGVFLHSLHNVFSYVFRY